MHGLNNLINNHVQLQRLDNINNNDDRQHYNLTDLHHLIATSYNHHVNSTYTFHIIIHQHIYIYHFLNHVILEDDHLGN